MAQWPSRFDHVGFPHCNLRGFPRHCHLWDTQFPMQVVTPFLPGDSLLFAAGTLAALGHLGLAPLLGVFITAATLGDAVNYAVGQFLGVFLAMV